MSTFHTTDKEISTPLNTPMENRKLSDHLELIIKSGDTSVFISPEMGGMVTRFLTDKVDWDIKDILYFDGADFEWSGKKPKIGIPVLMPFAWPDKPDNIVRQHGGLREVPWVWEDAAESSVTLSLSTRNIKDEELLSELRNKFGEDLDFKYTIRISVSGWILGYEIVIKNNGESDMPVTPWLHPYFRVDPERQAEMTSNLPGFNLSDCTWAPGGKALIFDRPSDGPVWFTIPGVWKVIIDCDLKFDTFLVWSKQNDKWEKEWYICVEPWIGRPHDINNPDKRINITPDEELQLSVNFRIEWK